MNIENVKFKGICEIEVRPKGKEKPSMENCCFHLELSSNLDPKAYYDRDGNMTAIGSKTITNVFVQGLVGNMHAAHQAGFMDSAEHLRYIIKELERGFVAQVEVDSKPVHGADNE